MGPDAMILVFWMLSFKPLFSLSSFIFIKRLFKFPRLAIAKFWISTRFGKQEWSNSCSSLAVLLKIAMLLLLLSHFSRVWLCATLWTATHQAPLSTGFSRQGWWSGLPFPSPWYSELEGDNCYENGAGQVEWEGAERLQTSILLFNQDNVFKMADLWTSTERE